MVPEIDSFGLAEGATLEVDLSKRSILVNGTEHRFIPLSADILTLIENGGVFSLYRT
jgi:hypothetical protein